MSEFSMKSPQDHLLQKIYANHGWGDPYGFDVTPEEARDFSELAEVGLLERHCHTKPVMEFSTEPDERDWSSWPAGFPDNIFDLLGDFKIGDTGGEGKVMVYEERVKGCGLMVYDKMGRESGFSRQYCIDMVREIILWHQLGHWILLRLPDENEERMEIKDLPADMHTEIQEAIAQIFVLFAILQQEDNSTRTGSLLVFNFMPGHQPGACHGYLDILQHKDFSWAGLFRALKRIRTNPHGAQADLPMFLNLMGLPV
jgi:hypothetical protein